MKPLTEQQIRDHEAASRRGAVEGVVVGTAAATSAGWYLNRRWIAYRNLPLTLKFLGGVIIVAPLLAIQAERRGLEYDRSQWDGAIVQMLEGRQEREQEAWQKLSTKEKITTWAAQHQYTIILGGWASSLCVAGTLIWRDRYQTPAQKIVQARMWAQGLTIGLLIVAGALTHSQKQARLNHAQPDHSWAEVLEQHEKERLEAEERTKSVEIISSPLTPLIHIIIRSPSRVERPNDDEILSPSRNLLLYTHTDMSTPSGLEKPLRLPLTKEDFDKINAYLSPLTPEEILSWAIDYLPGLYQTTAFGLSGLVATDILSKLSPSPPPLIFIDTFYHFPETYELVEEVKKQYNTPLHVFKPKDCDTVEEFEAKYGEKLWEIDENTYDYTVKVEPAQRAYDTLAVKSVITGRRASQGGDRANLKPLEVDSTGLLKLNPLFAWNFHLVEWYVKENKVPRNKLLDQGYKSVGDWHSTVKVGEGEDERAGRWAGREKTECGLHKDYFAMKAKAQSVV
ncbi:hypothetical protein AX15_000706 [Amanita polypyramis BW_CC]|nr:hypothetical protein AX15_000706 [Amanita polypyramis BW_CC]